MYYRRKSRHYKHCDNAVAQQTVTQTKTKVIRARVNEDVYKRFKARCEINQKNESELLRVMVEHFIANYRKINYMKVI